MKQILLRTLSFIATIVLMLTISGITVAHAVVNELFLQGTFMEIGINPNGHFGTVFNPPVPGPIDFYHDDTQPAYNGLGIVVDYQKDGWSEGSPDFGGDYITPGGPNEGWGVTWNGGASRASSIGDSVAGGFNAPLVNDYTATSLTGSCSGAAGSRSCSATWLGDDLTNTVRVQHSISFSDSSLVLTIATTITNLSGSTLSTLRFSRVVNPENEWAWKGSNRYDTHNIVVHQPDGSSNRALVTSRGTAYPEMLFSLVADDSRAKVTARTTTGIKVPAAVLDQSPIKTDETGDWTMGLGFELGSLAPGASVTVQYRYVLDASILPLPQITKITPNTGPVAGGSTITISGTDLTNSITFGGLSATCTALPDGTSATCTLPDATGIWAECSPVDLQATNTWGTATVVAGFTYGSCGSSSSLPATGFSQSHVTALPKQPADKAYDSAAQLTLNIPSIGVDASIVGVPQSGSSWDVTWLGRSVGYLNGTAFPTWAGNSVITGHVWDANNQPGVFAKLRNLSVGSTFTVKAFGATYTYIVRENRAVWNDSANAVAFQHMAGKSWITLVTCEGYSQWQDLYSFRRIVRAELVGVN